MKALRCCLLTFFPGVRNVDNQYKLSKNVKIAMLYLEDEDPVNAEVSSG